MGQLYSYGLLTASTVMFGLMFFFNDMFRKNYGSGLQATLVTTIGGGIFGLATLLIIKGFVLEFSWFALVMAVISAVNSLLFSFCSLKALGKINLSLYSLFSMLGGMALPFFSGIVFHGEALTVGKLVCFGIIAVALCMTTEKGENRGGTMIVSTVISLFLDKKPAKREIVAVLLSFVGILLLILLPELELFKINWR